MLPSYVTKKGRCAFCDAGVKKCKEPTCQQFFHASNKRHVFHSSKCKMKYGRRQKSLT